MKICRCKTCGYPFEAEIRTDTCPICIIDKTRGYRAMQMMGRCASGYESDRGKLYHAVKFNEYTAICGATPGKHSAGWSAYRNTGEITCKKCLKKLKELNLHKIY